MKNLKIKVDRNNAGEAIDLLVNLGHKLLSTKRGLICEVERGNTHIVNDGNGIFTTKNYYDVEEITIQQLRDMVNPMKEYLDKKYRIRKVKQSSGDNHVPDGWIEVPEWANYGYKNDKGVYFSMDGLGSPHQLLLWQRHTQPEELPFMDSLNDQYAEIEQVRKQTVEATLAERQAQYGCFEDVAFVTENIMAVLSKVRTNGLNDLPYPHRMALYMIASKMARIVNGDFNHKDSWHDIGGYSKLIEDLL